MNFFSSISQLTNYSIITIGFLTKWALCSNFSARTTLCGCWDTASARSEQERFIDAPATLPDMDVTNHSLVRRDRLMPWFYIISPRKSTIFQSYWWRLQPRSKAGVGGEPDSPIDQYQWLAWYTFRLHDQLFIVGTGVLYRDNKQVFSDGNSVGEVEYRHLGMSWVR